MDPFVIVILACLAALILCVWLLGRSNQGHGMEQLGLRSARQIVEDREALEAEDLDHLLETTKARQRARGLPERARDEVQREFGPGPGCARGG